MNYHAASKIFIFADESGDVGDSKEYSTASDEFTINLAVATDEGVATLETIGAGFKFFNFYGRELKKLREEHLRRFSDHFTYLKEVVFYGITINKHIYLGPYLRDTPKYAKNTAFFRNFILKTALEYVAAAEHILAFQKPVELIIDRYLHSEEEENNLVSYFKSYRRHVNLPKFLHVTQVDSRYCLPVQVLDVVQKIKRFDLDFCNNVPVPASLVTK